MEFSGLTGGKINMKTIDSKEKPFWETDQVLHWGAGLNSAPAADLMTLPVGTTFHVMNGFWDGKIVEKDGQKSVHVLDTGNVIKIDEINRYGLALSHVKVPSQWGKDKDGAEKEDIGEERE